MTEAGWYFESHLPSILTELPLRLFPVIFLVAALVIAAPVMAQPRDEAPEAVPAGPVPSAAEELTAKTTEQEKPAEAKKETPAQSPPEPDKKTKPVKKTSAKDSKKPAAKTQTSKATKESHKPEPKKETAEKKPSPTPAAPAAEDPVIVINPCTGDVAEELPAPPQIKTARGGKTASCLTQRQCTALCRASETFGSGGGSPHLTPEGDVIFSTESFTSTNDCVSACTPQCE